MAFYFDKSSIQLIHNSLKVIIGDTHLNDRTYKEKIVLIGCMIGVIGFIPFTIYRFVNGDYLLAFIESCLAMSILGIFIYVWRTHKVDMPATLMSALFLGAVVAVVHIKGPTLIYWIYPATLSCFCITKPRTASLLNLMSMLLLFPALYPALSSQEVVLIYVTLTLLCVFGYAFTLISYQQYLDLSKLAARDALTGTWNRRALDDALNQIISKHQRNPIKASLIIMDLDHFKRINDTFGHGVGDQVLIKVAELIGSTVRISDQLYRYGGEEFVLIAEGADLDEAALIAETIRHRVEKSELFEKQKITLSLGVAELSQAPNAHEWLTLADDALYQAKDGGRNRYCLAPQAGLQQAA